MAEENGKAPSGRLLTRSERAALKRLQRAVGYHKKDAESKKKLLPKLIETVKANEERRETETAFARNVSVATKHERRVNVKRRWRMYTFLVTAVFVLLLVGYVLYSYVFVVDTITVTGTDRYTSDEIASISGIAVGDNLFSSSIDEGAVSERIVKYFPYVKSIKIKRILPNAVTIEVVEEEAVFVSEIYGQTALISAELRVLELSDTAPQGDYIKLTLPEVKSALAGQNLQFKDDVFSVALRAAGAVASPAMRDGTTVLNISDRFGIYISYEGRYKLVIGDINDIDLKLALAFEIMKDDAFATGNKGTIYLENVNSPSVIIDNQLNLD